jgi:uncharacterized phage protein (TIGR01671 family)
MTREIKFRAWDGKMMHYGGFSIHATGKVEVLKGLVPRSLKIMEYTGVTDKHGSEIYEGDTVEYEEWAIVEEKWQKTGAIVKRPIVWIGDMLTTEWSSQGLKVLMSINHEFTIVGNIHENPELTEE